MPTRFLEKYRRFLGRLVAGLGRTVLRNPLIPACSAAMVGIGVVDQWRWNSLPYFLGGLSLVLVFWRLRRTRLGSAIAAAGAAFLVFGFWHAEKIARIDAFPLAAEISEGRSIEVQGRGWIADRPRHADSSFSAIVSIDSISIDGREIECRHRVPARVAKKSHHEIRYGDRIEFSGLLLPPEEADVSGAFDPATFYYREHGSLARLEIRTGDDFLSGVEETGMRQRGTWLVRKAQRLRDRFETSLRKGLLPQDDPYARLVAAMALGARENSPDDLEEAFRQSGTMHMFAVSGLHVGVVAGMVFVLLRLCGVPLRVAAWIVIPVVLFYAVMTGLRPSAVRAATMAAVGFAGLALGERQRLLNSLAFAGLILLAADTQQLFLPGFQLSFAVMFFLVLFAAPLHEKFARPWLCDPFLPQRLRKPWQRLKDGMISGVAGVLAVSVTAWLGSVGLLTWHFQSIAPVGVLANCVLVWLAGIVVATAMAACLVSLVHLSPVVVLLNKLTIGVAIQMVSIAQFFAELPGAQVHTGSVSLPSVMEASIDVMGEYGEGAVLLSLPASKRERMTRWMIDSGGENTFSRQVLPLFRSLGVNEIDGVFLTHGDSGHIGAMPRLMGTVPPKMLFESEARNRSPVYPTIISLVERREIPRVSLSPGQRIRVGSDKRSPTVSVLAPQGEVAGRLADDRVLVLRLAVEGWRILFTADAGFATETALLDSGIDLRSDLWIRGQHADEPSGLSRFVDAVSAKAIVSTASDFPIGERLTEEFRAAVEESGGELFSLDEHGVVSITLNAERVLIRTHQGGVLRELRRD